MSQTVACDVTAVKPITVYYIADGGRLLKQASELKVKIKTTRQVVSVRSVSALFVIIRAK